MAGGFVALYTQDFTTTSSITVTHNLDRVVCAVRVIIGAVVRNDLVESVIPSAADPRNVIIVTLKASNSGTIQIIDSDYIWGTLPTPEGAAALENNISGSTFSGSFTGSFSGDGSALTGIPPGTFGADFQTAESLARDTTTSTTFQTKLTLIASASTGRYRIGWSSVVDQNNTRDSVEARLQNTTDASTVGEYIRHEPKDTNNRFTAGGFAYIDMVGSAKTFEIQWRQQNGSTAGIAAAIIEWWRVT